MHLVKLGTLDPKSIIKQSKENCQKHLSRLSFSLEFDIHKPYENFSKLNELIHGLNFLNKIPNICCIYGPIRPVKKNLGRTGICFDLFLVLSGPYARWGERVGVRLVLGFGPAIC